MYELRICSVQAGGFIRWIWFLIPSKFWFVVSAGKLLTLGVFHLFLSTICTLTMSTADILAYEQSKKLRICSVLAGGIIRWICFPDSFRVLSCCFRRDIVNVSMERGIIKCRCRHLLATWWQMLQQHVGCCMWTVNKLCFGFISLTNAWIPWRHFEFVKAAFILKMISDVVTQKATNSMYFLLHTRRQWQNIICHERHSHGCFLGEPSVWITKRLESYKRRKGGQINLADPVM
jgi:hypothetical protein